MMRGQKVIMDDFWSNSQAAKCVSDVQAGESHTQDQNWSLEGAIWTHVSALLNKKRYYKEEIFTRCGEAGLWTTVIIWLLFLLAHLEVFFCMVMYCWNG